MDVKKWNIYFICGGKKNYLRRGITTLAAVSWLNKNCHAKETNFFMHGTGIQIFCESK